MHKLSQKEYFEIFEKESLEEVKLTTMKNTDYATDNDAFQNFNTIEFLTNGSVSTEVGIYTRLCDKFQRVASLLIRSKDSHKIKDESIIDTLRDISVYAKILRIYIMTKHLSQNEDYEINNIMDNINKDKIPTVANLHKPPYLHLDKGDIDEFRKSK